MKFYLLFFLFFICNISNSQTDSIALIRKSVAAIDSDTSLVIQEFDAAKVYGNSYDGGGRISIYSDQNGIRKIEEEIGLSYGRVTTIIYLQSSIPILIIDREENFAFLEKEGKRDHTRLNKVFEASIYIFDWEETDNKTIITGKRNMSEGTCGTLEYEPLITLAEKLLEGNR